MQLLKYEVDINERQILELLDKIINVENLNLIIKDYLFDIIDFNLSSRLSNHVAHNDGTYHHMVYINYNKKLYTLEYCPIINITSLLFDNIELTLIFDGTRFFTKIHNKYGEKIHDIINIYNFLVEKIENIN
jgi:hypothetical protein